MFWPFAAAPPEEDPIDSIAVLPFENVTNDSDWDFLSDGISEDIINSLSQMNDLKVISRASSFRYRERDIDPQAVGNELGVRALVTGRVLVRDDDLSIRAGLIDVEENAQLWGGEFNGKLREILEMRKSIATEISDELSPRLTPEEKTRLARTYTQDDQAHAAYLKGRFEQAKSGARRYRRAIQYFEQAIERDPNYAQAWAALARSHYRLVTPYRATPAQEAMPKAEEAAMRALELDDTLSEAHAVLADVKRAYHWDWTGAEEEYKLALELNPGSFDAPNQYAFFLSGMGRHDESADMGRRAQQLNPLDPSMRAGARAAQAHAAYLKGKFEQAKSGARRYRRAIQYFEQAIERDPNYAQAWAALARSHYRLVTPYRATPAQEAMPKAEEAAMRALELDDTLSEAHAVLADVKRAYHWDWTGAEEEYKLALELNPGSFDAPNQYAFFLSGMGRHDESADMGRRAQQLNPLDPSMRAGACARLSYARRYDEAIQQCQAALEMEPDYVSAYRDLGQVYEDMGLYEEAAAARQKEWTLSGSSEEEVAGLTAAAISGEEDYWRWTLDYWKRKVEQGYVSPRTFAIAYAALGERDQAFEWLEKAYQVRDALLLTMINPLLDPLRDDPRFQDLLRRMNLEP